MTLTNPSLNHVDQPRQSQLERVVHSFGKKGWRYPCATFTLIFGWKWRRRRFRSGAQWADLSFEKRRLGLTCYFPAFLVTKGFTDFNPLSTRQRVFQLWHSFPRPRWFIDSDASLIWVKMCRGKGLSQLQHFSSHFSRLAEKNGRLGQLFCRLEEKGWVHEFGRMFEIRG